MLALQPYLKANPGKTRDDYDHEVSKIMLAASPDLVVLAGWMHILGDAFFEQVERKGVPVINLHPALPGAFDGANAIQRAFDAFGRGDIEQSGVMVHKVIREVDRGEPVLVRAVKMEREDTLEDFEQRLHQTEWGVIVEATKIVLESRRWVLLPRMLDRSDGSLAAGSPHHRLCTQETKKHNNKFACISSTIQHSPPSTNPLHPVDRLSKPTRTVLERRLLQAIGPRDVAPVRGGGRVRGGHGCSLTKLTESTPSSFTLGGKWSLIDTIVQPIQSYIHQHRQYFSHTSTSSSKRPISGSGDSGLSPSDSESSDC